jgi:ribosomal protein S18 acetylase RimI-like enzyme
VGDFTIACSDRFLFARQADRVIGVMGVVPQPGGTGLVFPPEIEADSDADEVAYRLIEAALIRLQRAGSTFAQLVLTLSERPRAIPFERRGFRHFTDGLMLTRDARQFPSKTDPRLTERVCNPTEDEELLVSLIESINRGSLDCPELDGWRTSAQLFEGHLAAAQSRRSSWTVYDSAGFDIGLSIAMDGNDEGGCELLTFGVVPGFRGRGFGRAILEFVASKSPVIHAACDVRNRYAKETYAKAGFVESDRAGIWIHSLGKPR